MKNAFFFGYGSLVNRSTHIYTDAHPASVRGWRRAWRHTDLRGVSFLTVVPDADCTIDGLIAGVPGDDWAALDEREAAYGRVPVSDHVDHPLPQRPEIAIYAIAAPNHHSPTDAHPILLSYIDVVLQGYLREFGTKGAQRFLDTTDGWHAPVLDDRAAPQYPRHQLLTSAERAFVDDALAGKRVTRRKA